MRVLGIESSCDETAAAVLEDGVIRSSVVHSQDEVHARFGGVVPELASREHLVAIEPTVRGALEEAGVTLRDIDHIAVTTGPGLIGSLLVGVSFAQALAYVRGCPLVPVHHLEGHLLAPFLDDGALSFPFVGLIVSGGHTALYLARSLGQYTLLGGTRDDAAGEAFDKVAKLMNLGYPGGARIDALAATGNPTACNFPRAMRGRGLEFSFSGLKTAVLLQLQKAGEAVAQADIAASFQAAVVDILVEKTLQAARAHRVPLVVVSGGVAANSRLRSQLESACNRDGFEIRLPRRAYCTDNAAMIAWAGWHRVEQGLAQETPWKVDARWQL